MFLLSAIQHGQLSTESRLVRASANFGVCNILPFIHCDHPLITFPSAAVSAFMLDLWRDTKKRQIPDIDD